MLTVEKPELHQGNQAIREMLELKDGELEIGSLWPILRSLGSYREFMMGELAQQGLRYVEFWGGRAPELLEVHRFQYDRDGNLILHEQDLLDQEIRKQIESKFKIEDKDGKPHLVCETRECDSGRMVVTDMYMGVTGSFWIKHKDGQIERKALLKSKDGGLLFYCFGENFDEQRDISIRESGIHTKTSRTYEFEMHGEEGEYEGISSRTYSAQTSILRNSQNQVFHASFPINHPNYDTMSFDIKRDEIGRVLDMEGRYVKNGLTDELVVKTVFNYSGDQCIVDTQLDHGNLPENWNVLGGVY
jgi:hypothetical protein